MYISKKNADKISDAFTSYGIWSDKSRMTEGDKAYAFKRCAQAVLVLVGLGIPHHLEDWALETLADPYFSNADYTGRG
mgnify:CR=1 FL=1|tara:strand:+ start:254 stop:487 length:234 start_codon:yes stop_codon:yes gene_type:complete